MPVPDFLKACQPIFLHSRDATSWWIVNNILDLFRVGCNYKFVPYTNIYTSDKTGRFTGVDLVLDKPFELMFLGIHKRVTKHDGYPDDIESYAKFLYDSRIIYLEKAEIKRADIYVYSTSDIVRLAKEFHDE